MAEDHTPILRATHTEGSAERAPTRQGMTGTSRGQLHEACSTHSVTANSLELAEWQE